MNQIQDAGLKEVSEGKRDIYHEKDSLKEAGRVLNYLDVHPGVGFMAGGTLVAGGISALIYYGSKLFRVS